jgi:hypothetical protein
MTYLIAVQNLRNFNIKFQTQRDNTGKNQYTSYSINDCKITIIKIYDNNNQTREYYNNY